MRDGRARWVVWNSNENDARHIATPRGSRLGREADEGETEDVARERSRARVASERVRGGRRARKMATRMDADVPFDDRERRSRRDDDREREGGRARARTSFFLEVGPLSARTSATHVKEIFGGDATEATVTARGSASSATTNAERRFTAVVGFASEEARDRAVEAMDGGTIDEREVRCERARGRGG